jgi:type IV pilus assembly protein PilM
MAEVGTTVWAIDIGSCSLKALHLSTARGVAEVVGFDHIRHGKVLSGPKLTEAEKEELVAISLRKFATRHDLSMDEIVISVPSQNSFARFVNLPPVEQKRIAEIVKFEAVQQIPFDINEVQWDWQLMTEPDAPELKVGIFAIKNDVVNAELERFNREDVQVGYVQMSPMALYNYVVYDRADLLASPNQAVVVLNIGASSTDLVVCTKSTVWQRAILIGGNSFTQAISEAFKLDFEKAEKLKRTAPVSKYARQLFQAMRSVYTDLASEIQRSLGFYSSSNPNTKIVKVIAMGGGTQLRGLLKYMQQTLQIPVERPDVFRRLAIGSGIPAAKFHENVGNFGVVYGLGLQGLGLASIESNLLPRSVARSIAWVGKGRYFIAAACLLFGVSLLALGRTALDRMTYSRNGSVRQGINRVIVEMDGIKSQMQDVEQKRSEAQKTIDREFVPFEYRQIIPEVYETILSALPDEKNNPSQADLYKAFRKGAVAEVVKIPRKDRQQVFVTNMAVYYSTNLETAQFGGAGLWRTSRGKPQGRGESGEISEAEYEMMLQMMSGGEYEYSPFAQGLETKGEERKAGFVVTIAGYSPYRDLGLLMDPPGVDSQPAKWGFVTRLVHLDDLVDGNSPFELYKKGEPDHWKLTTGEVAWDAEMPGGIGAIESRYVPTKVAPSGPSGPAGPSTNIEWYMVDPLTKETINKVDVLDELGRPKLYRGQPMFEVNDHWFVLNLKLVWRDGPKIAAQPTMMQQMMGSAPAAPSSAPAKSQPARPAPLGGRRKEPSFDL